jgi:hypothetical protein
MDDAVSQSPSPPLPLGSNPKDRWAHRRGEPRSFAAAWVLYLFAAVVFLTASVGVIGLMAWDVYRVMVRMLVVFVAVAVWIVWPMVRLSQDPPRRPVASAIADWLLVSAPVLGVIWPQGFAWMARWPWSVCLALSLWMLGVGACAGAVLAWRFSCQPSDATTQARSGRWLTMLAMVVVAFAAPLVATLRPGEPMFVPSPRAWDGLLMLSPVSGAFDLVRDRSYTGMAAVVATGHWWCIGGVWLVAGAMWGVAIRAARCEVRTFPRG